MTQDMVPRWVYVVAALVGVLSLFGAALSQLKPELMVAPRALIGEATRVYAGYLFSRNCALAVVLYGALATKSRVAIGTMLAAFALTNAFDVVLDAVERRYQIVLVAIFLACVCGLTAYRVLRIRTTWA